jgi:hypothetical protein
MSFHPTLDTKALRDDLVGLMTWAQKRSLPGQINNFSQTYSDYRSGNITEAKAGAMRGAGYALDTALMASLLGGGMAGGGVHTYRALGMGKRIQKLNQSLGPHIFKIHILWEVYERDLEWQDIPYYAAPWVAQVAWDRYTIKNQVSSSVARRGNAVGPGGGKKKKITYTGKSGRRTNGNAPPPWVPCTRWSKMGRRCYLRKGHRGRHRFP